MERSAKRRQGNQARSIKWGAKRRRTGGNDGTAGGASSTHTSTEGQEVATSLGYDYEVFLSFRGPDTRPGFTDFLYTSLKTAGIRTFKDDEDLRKGVEFAPELLRAIKQSKILIPIFSKDYASSVWCLKEVVRMVECEKRGGGKIMPIFYDVAPSEVRHQIGNYEEPFRLHERKKRYDQKTIREWKHALRAVGAINGWELPREPIRRREGEFVKKFTQKIFNELKKASLVVSNNLVGVDHRVDEIMEMIGAQTSETWIIGIHGMGGIGKTTIAKIIYNRLSSNFEDCCFLSNIRETSKRNGVECLQKQLIYDILRMKETDINNVDQGTQEIEDRFSNKKVLLLLDDVETKSHIDALLGKRDWFGKGSKIIITTRNKNILRVPKVDHIYELKCMDRDQSLQLFSKHAFRRDSPLDKYINQSNKAVDIAGGLPLALEVIGSLLCSIDKKKWDGKLKELENIPHEDVLSKLKISYEALRDHEQHIFLDIACLFIGLEKAVVIYFWDESRFFPKEAMDVLENMSLIKIGDDNKVLMHDQVRDLGREIVRRESNRKIEEQSRVWDPEEVLSLLRRQKKKKKLEALRLHFDHQRRFAYEDFKRLPNLSFLEVCGSGTFRAEKRLLWHASPSNVFPTNEDSHLLPELRWLSWHDIPPKFNITNFSAANVVILNLSQSDITNDWKGWSHVKMMENLKVMDLTWCNYLERTPEFSAHSKLERLTLHNCWVLDEIDESICQLESLVFLDVSYCRNLQRLPNKIGNLKSLMELNILDTGIKELPNSIGNLNLLNKLEISKLGFQELPHSIGSLKSLIKLDISFTGIKRLPDSVGKLKNLKVVKMILGSTSKIPDALWTIKKLEEIEVIASCHFDVKIGNGIYRNRSLRILKLTGVRIYVVPRLPESLTILRLLDLDMNMFPDLSNLTNLKELKLQFVGRDSNGESDGHVEEDPMPLRIGSLHGESDGPMENDLPQWIGNLSKLESLDLRSPYVTTIPIDIRSLLPQLKSLRLFCPNLRCLPSLPSSLSNLDLQSKCVAALPTHMSSLLPRLEKLKLNCPNLRCLPSLPSTLLDLNLESKYVTALSTDMSSFLPQLRLLLLTCPNLRCLRSLPSSLSSLSLYDCMSGCSMEGEDLSNLKTLSTLYIKGCAISEIRGLDRLENLQQLCLTVYDCGNLVEIQGELPPSLNRLQIWECGSLQKLPDLSNLKELREVYIRDCGKLNVEAISSLCSEKGVEFKGDTYEREKMRNLIALFVYGSEEEDRGISARRS